jgi:hypothetical protein
VGGTVGPGPGPGPGPDPGPGVTNPTPTTTPAYCKRFPKLRATLIRQLKAAKKARIKAETKPARAKAAKRIKTIKLQQKRSNAKFKATCRIGAAR